jgi:PAS domain S-box-containing protein
MQEEPEIVKILREEEQRGQLQTKLLECTQEASKSDSDTGDGEQGTITMFSSNENKNLTGIKEEYFDALCNTILHYAPIALLVVDDKGMLLDANERIDKWLGYKPHEVIGKNLFTLPFFTKETQTILKKKFAKRTSFAPISLHEIEMLTKQGQKRIGIIHTTPLKNEHKKIIADLVVISDITEQKEMEETMRIKDSAIASSINAIAFADLEGNITYVNKSFLKMWGYQNENDVIGKPIGKFWKIKAQSVEVIDTLRNNGEWVGELTGVKKDNSTFQVQLSANMIKDEFNKPICIMGSFVDITKYKIAVKALSESQKKFRVVLENSLDMIYQLNLKKGTYE